MPAWMRVLPIALLLVAASGSAADVLVQQRPISGWLHWRGPQQNGTSTETELPDRWKPGGKNHLWTIDLASRGTPVIARHPEGDRVYAWGYRGAKTDLVEVLVCLEADTGRKIWERSFSDFISDIIYDRYSIGAPTVDAETGNVYLMTSPGLLTAFDADGEPLWQRSLMEDLGRLTFPNGRTGAASVEGDLVIVNAISTNWGREGPARNRFYAFDKTTGDLVWSSTPGVGPPFLKDSSFSSPYFDWRDGRRVFYVGTGCGNVVCVTAGAGDPLWRMQLAMGGVNSSPLVHGDTLVAIHGKENVDDSRRGRMVGINLTHAFEAADGAPAAGRPAVIGAAGELWRNDDLSMFTSSPVLADGLIYQVTVKGDLVCVDAADGKTLWHKKLGADQLHASPLHADGKLYVPMWHDGLYILEPNREGVKVLDHVKLEGACLGSPSIWNGRVYLHTTTQLHCFGTGGDREPPAGPTATHAEAGEAVRCLAVPAEVLLRPGASRTFSLRFLDAKGNLVRKVSDWDADPATSGKPRPKWRVFIPPQAKVRAQLHAGFDDKGRLVAGPKARASAGAFAADVTDPDSGRTLKTTIRGRLLPSPPYRQNFESFNLKHEREDASRFAYPPLPWLGARLKWQVRDLNGDKVLTKTLDRWLFQRSVVFMGHADDHGYTLSADVMSDGNRRGMSDVGLINQHYFIILRGNGQQLEVNSNIERLAEMTPLAWEPGTWYRLKTRVDVEPDGSGVVRGKVWPRDNEEPADWTIAVPVARVHADGSPGLFGFSANIKFAVYIDNIAVVPNNNQSASLAAPPHRKGSHDRQQEHHAPHEVSSSTSRRRLLGAASGRLRRIPG